MEQRTEDYIHGVIKEKQKQKEKEKRCMVRCVCYSVLELVGFIIIIILLLKQWMSDENIHLLTRFTRQR